MSDETKGQDVRSELEKLLGSRVLEKLSPEIVEELAESWGELSFGVSLETEADREGEARRILAGLTPMNIDVKLWANLAAGRNIDLPVSDNYGSFATRLAPSGAHARLGNKSKGNDFGRVHSKGTQEPSSWLHRQGSAATAKLKRIGELEAQLAEEREDFASLQHGLKTYGATLLLTALRKATAPLFAMGPAWTLLEAIAGPSNEEVVPEDRERQTKLILLALHALRDDIAFRKEMKTAIFTVCRKYEGAMRQRGKDVWDLPYDPSEILNNLGFPGSV